MLESVEFKFILDILNKRESLNKLGVQGNIFMKILDILGYTEYEFDNYSNGISVDCLISIEDKAVLPCEFLEYSKNDRENIQKYVEKSKVVLSLLKQYMIKNNLIIGLIFTGYLFAFYKLENNEIKLVRYIWMNELSKDNDNSSEDEYMSDLEFLDGYTIENIEETLINCVDINGIAIKVIEDFLKLSESSKKYLQNIAGIQLEDNILKEIVKRVLGGLDKEEEMNKDFSIKKEEKSKNISEEIDEDVNIQKSKVEKENRLQYISNIINQDIPILDKFKALDYKPTEFIIGDEIYSFDSWRNFGVNIIEYIYSVNKIGYKNIVKNLKDKLSFTIISKLDERYEKEKNNEYKKYFILSNKDLCWISGNRLEIIKKCLDLLCSENIPKHCVSVYFEESELLEVY